MGLDLRRWFAYAKAKLDQTVAEESAELDRMEAERAADVAERPWIAAEGSVPTLDEARARIEWETERQHRAGRPEGSAPPGGTGAPGSPLPDGVDPDPTGSEAELAAARVELDRQALEAKARLEAIRAELDADRPAT